MFKKLLDELSQNSFQGINEKIKDGNTILHLAAELPNSKTVKLLIEKGSDVKSKNDQGETPLHRAAYRGKVRNVKEIIKAGGRVDERSNDESTPLHYAAMLGSRGNIKGAIKELIKGGAEINAQNNKQRTPLLEAVYIIKDIESIRMLIRSGCDVNVEDYLGHTALRYANMGDDERVVKMLLDAEGKKDLNKIGEGYENIKPRDVYKEMLKEIESKSYEGINEKDKDGKTVLHLAVNYGNAEVVKQLIAKGADVNIGDDQGKRALHYAALFGKTKTVKVLIEKGANINATDNSRYVPLHLACLKGAIGVVKELIKAGCNVNAVDKFGHSPLYYARNKTELVKLLEKSSGKIIDKSEDIMSGVENTFEGVIDVFERLALPELEGKILNLDEVKKRDKSLIAKDLIELRKKNEDLMNEVISLQNGLDEEKD